MAGRKEAASRYRSSLSQYHSIMEYIMRRLFRILYGDDRGVMFQWLVRGYWPKATITNVVIASIKKSDKGSTVRHVLQAILHGGFSRDDLNTIIKQHEQIVEGYEGLGK